MSINYFHSALTAGQKKTFTVMMVNDAARAKSGELVLAYLNEQGVTTTQSTQEFHLLPLGASSHALTIAAPPRAGQYLLQAKATAVDDASDPTRSRRWITIEP